MWSGTITFTPFSRIAGLRPEVTAWPLSTASASLISKVAVSGSNIFIGKNAGYSATTNGGNICIGRDAGYSTDAAGTNATANIFIGNTHFKWKLWSMNLF